MAAWQSLIVSMRSWKTTTVGAVTGSIVAYWSFVDPSILPTEHAVGLLAIAIGANGLLSKDGNKSTEDVNRCP